MKRLSAVPQGTCRHLSCRPRRGRPPAQRAPAAWNCKAGIVGFRIDVIGAPLGLAPSFSIAP